MVNVDADLLECDLAETYGIYDYRQLPLTKVAAFSYGLRESSRIKQKLRGERYPLDTLLLSVIADRLAVLIWHNTQDAVRGQNKPESIYEKLTEKNETEVAVMTIDEFKAVREEHFKEAKWKA